MLSVYDIAINVVPGLSDFAAAAVGNGGNPPPTNKPIGLRAQCDKEGSGLESVGDFVVVCWLVGSLAHSAALRLVSGIVAHRLVACLAALWLVASSFARSAALW
ncbi:MAG: hypothetical protein FRX48_03048 [Lasallia pustulata]|uniref:Uncharacterized protein n=1 Tax=Lasallia pustulata TaxID=136370 RepID=A0A5M8PW72_9LECA|nr:MAG: hypothetical protein FRX48_03048 [Lasallia pustulata]